MMLANTIEAYAGNVKISYEVTDDGLRFYCASLAGQELTGEQVELLRKASPVEWAKARFHAQDEWESYTDDYRHGDPDKDYDRLVE